MDVLKKKKNQARFGLDFEVMCSQQKDYRTDSMPLPILTFWKNQCGCDFWCKLSESVALKSKKSDPGWLWLQRVELMSYQ